MLGTALVSYAMRTHGIPIVRRQPISETRHPDLGTVDERTPEEVDEESLGLSQITAAFRYIALAILAILVVAAIGTMSLATLGANIPALVTFTLIGACWSVVAVLWIAPRIHGVRWFEPGVADFGQSQGNVATGFILTDMADPKRQTNAATAYGYKQLTYEPLLGGGIITALAIPLIADVGLMPFAVASAIITVALAAWGMLRRGTP